MHKSNNIADDYRIAKIDQNDEIYFKDKTDYIIDIDYEDPYKEIDEYCDKMNRIKYRLLKKSRIAGMGGVVVSTNEKTIIGTTALDTCYGILFYDRVNKEGICGHAVPGQLTSVLAEMMGWLDGRVGIIEYMLLPGFRNVDRHDYSGFDELYNFLMSRKPIGIKLTDMKNAGDVFKLHQDTFSYEFAFDTEHGVFVTDYVFFDSVEHNPRFNGPKRRY